jgi:NTE family protein
MTDPGESALVLGGGAIKGAFQAGALRYILGDYGFRPAIIYGISVGALNGAFLADRAGRALGSGREPDWPQIGIELSSFWEQRVTRPADILKPRFSLLVAWHILTKNFQGIVNPAPLHRQVREEFDPQNLARIRFAVGTVDVGSGKILYADSTKPELRSRMVDYIIASTAIPVVMPLQTVDNKIFYDGGLIDVAPVNKAIKAGATQILCVACQPEQVVDPGSSIAFQPGDLGKLFERVSDILANEILKNDLKIVDLVNLMVETMAGTSAPWPERLRKYKKVSAMTIRPEKVMDVDMLKFNREQIKALLDLGYETAKRTLEPTRVTKAIGATVGR